MNAGHSELYQKLSQEFDSRTDSSLFEVMDQMCKLYAGTLPAEYEKYFPKKSIRIFIQLVKNAWDDLATTAGRLPDLRSDPLDETQREEKAAGLHERIGYHYFSLAEPTGKQYMKQLAWWLLGAGRAVALIRPDYNKMEPILTVRDPRNARPNMRTVNGIPVELYDIIFRYEIDRKVGAKMGLCEERPRGQFPGASIQKLKVVEVVDDLAYTIVSEEGYMIREPHNLGGVPAWVFQNFNPENEGGLSLFKDQVSIQVAVSMLITLKLAAADKNVNPIYWAKGHVGTLKIGPNVINKLSSQGEIGRLDPPSIPQVDRDLQQLTEFSNILNKNPEVRQGQVDTKGTYQSAKTMEQLAATVDTTVGDAWDIISAGQQHLMAMMFKMDEVNWADKEKRITVNVRGKKYRDVYTPSKDINGRYAIRCDYSLGVGGYQGFLQNLQANAAKMLSRETAMGSMPGNNDIAQEQRKIELEDLDDAQMANIQSQAANGAMDTVFMAKVRKMVAGGTPLFEAILKLEEEAQAQAQAAVESGATAPVTNPGPPEEAAPAPSPPGLNPAVLV